MTALTVRQAAERFGMPRSQLYELCRLGALSGACREHIHARGRRVWVVEADEVRAYLKRTCTPRALDTAGEWMQMVPPTEAGELTPAQEAFLAAEWWHELEDMQPCAVLDHGTAVHVRWSDSESYILFPDGETDRYRYERVGTQWEAHRRKAIRER